jgi:hypothetical protein
MAFRKHDESLQFRNGNLNLKISKEDLKEFNKDQVLFLSDLLFWFDCEFIGETFFLSNYDTGHIIYNSYMDCWYIFNWVLLDTLATGKTVKLYARKMDDEMREMVEKER